MIIEKLQELIGSATESKQALRQILNSANAEELADIRDFAEEDISELFSRVELDPREYWPELFVDEIQE